MIKLRALPFSLRFSSWKQLVTLVLASACGGTSTPNDIATDPIDNPSPLMFATLNSLSTELAHSVQGKKFTELSSVPTSGVSTYSGIVETRATVGPLERQSMIGAATIEFQFTKAASQFSGVVSSLFTRSGEQVQGQLEVSSGQLDRAGDPTIDRTLKAYLSGPITFPDEPVTNYDLILEGDLIGNGGQLAAGGIFGIATNREGTSTVIGQFVLEN